MKKIEFLCVGLISTTLFLSCKKEPVADFSYSSPMEVGKQIKFENLSSHSSTYNWDFGDNSTSTEQSPSHVYEKPGNYNVTLNAKGDGGSTSINKSIIITGITYSIKNSTSVAISNFCSFYWNGTDIEDFVQHGTLSVGQTTKITITDKTEISFGFTYLGATFVSVNPFILTPNKHNDLLINNNTLVYSDSKKSLTLANKETLDKIIEKIEFKLKN
jgi:PKD repeat protein